MSQDKRQGPSRLLNWVLSTLLVLTHSVTRFYPLSGPGTVAIRRPLPSTFVLANPLLIVYLIYIEAPRPAPSAGRSQAAFRPFVQRPRDGLGSDRPGLPSLRGQSNIIDPIGTSANSRNETLIILSDIHEW